MQYFLGTDIDKIFPLIAGGLYQTWNISKYVKHVLVKCSETKSGHKEIFALNLSINENSVPREVLNFTHITEIKSIGK